MPDSRGYLLPNERRALLRRYAPVLVLFPERRDQAPYPDDGDAIYTMRGSYHPRSVDFFLKYARVRYHPRVLLRSPRLWFKRNTAAQERDRVTDAVSHDELRIEMEEHQNNPDFTGLGDADFRAAILAHLVQERLSERIKGFDLPLFRGHNLRHWKAYYKYLAETDPVTRRSVVYGRLVQGLAPLGKDQAEPESELVQVSHYGPYDVSQTRVALQYWFHYIYDDWANRHEGDWEMITLLLEVDPGVIASRTEIPEAELLTSVRVMDVGYASHEEGYRRMWEDVQKTKDGRPIVYVARGSSASYFGWQLDGYPTSARVGIVEKVLAGLGTLVQERRIFGRRWDVDVRARFTGRDPKNTDWVAADPQPDDRLDPGGVNPLEVHVPVRCRGVRRIPDFGVSAGQDNVTYHLETDDLFWAELVQEFGAQWGQNSPLPGGQGPKGLNKAERDKLRDAINRLGQVESRIEKALDLLIQVPITPFSAIPELDRVLRPLRPPVLRQNACFPSSVRPYVYDMWAAILRSHPEAWPGGPGLFLRLRFFFQPRVSPLLERQDPLYHLKSLLAVIRRRRYEVQHEGSKWDNPFAWVRHICLADTFYYGITAGQRQELLDVLRLDCTDVDMSAT